jgi:hypothetical protein
MSRVTFVDPTDGKVRKLAWRIYNAGDVNWA